MYMARKKISQTPKRKSSVSSSRSANNTPMLITLIIVVSVILGAVVVNLSQRMKEVKMLEVQSQADEAYAETINSAMRLRNK